MIQKVAFLLAAVFLGFLCATAVQAETVRGEGRYTSQTLTHLMPFNAVEVNGDIQVAVRQMPDQTVTLSGPANLAVLADVRVEKDTLVIDYKRPIHVRGEALQVSVFVPELTALTVRGNGKLEVFGQAQADQLSLIAADHGKLSADSLQANQVRVQAMNHAEIDVERLNTQHLEAAAFDKAEIDLSGFAHKAVLTNHSTEDLEAEDLRVNDATATVNGSGDVSLFAMQTLKATANGRGKIEYHGTPVVTRAGNAKKIVPVFKD